MILDIILIVALLLFSLWGWNKGLIKTLGYLVSLVLGIILALLFFRDLSLVISKYIELGALTDIISWILIFLFVISVTQIIVVIVHKSITPIMEPVDKLLGGVLGLILGVVVVGLSLSFLSLWIGPWIEESNIGVQLMKIGFLLRSIGG